MKQVTLHEAETSLSALVEEAAAGEDIVIAKNGRPRARLVAMGPVGEATPKRVFGFWRRYGYVSPETFPETDEAEIALWESGEATRR